MFGASTYADSSKTKGRFIHVSFGVRTCHECHASEGPRGAIASILH